MTTKVKCIKIEVMTEAGSIKVNFDMKNQEFAWKISDMVDKLLEDAEQLAIEMKEEECANE
jgi:hypothetical protein